MTPAPGLSPGQIVPSVPDPVKVKVQLYWSESDIAQNGHTVLVVVYLYWVAAEIKETFHFRSHIIPPLRYVWIVLTLKLGSNIDPGVLVSDLDMARHRVSTSTILLQSLNLYGWGIWKYRDKQTFKDLTDLRV